MTREQLVERAKSQGLAQAAAEAKADAYIAANPDKFKAEAKTAPKVEAKPAPATQTPKPKAEKRPSHTYVFEEETILPSGPTAGMADARREEEREMKAMTPRMAVTVVDTDPAPPSRPSAAKYMGSPAAVEVAAVRAESPASKARATLKAAGYSDDEIGGVSEDQLIRAAANIGK